MSRARVPMGRRWSRALPFAGAAASLTIAAHAVAGGGWPDGGTTLVLTALVAGAATAFADRQRPTIVIAAALGVAQLAVHLVLDTLPAHHDRLAAPAFDGWTMTAAHATATLLTALLLARADAAVLAVLAAGRSLLPVVAPFQPITSAGATPLPAAAPVVDVLRQVVFRTGCARRGPPCPC